MKITVKKILNKKNISNFLEGNIKYWYNALFGLPKHIQEQVAYRINLCDKDCMKKQECIYCGCDPIKKAFVIESCNKGERFPDIMDKDKWEQFKKENNVDIN